MSIDREVSEGIKTQEKANQYAQWLLMCGYCMEDRNSDEWRDTRKITYTEWYDILINKEDATPKEAEMIIKEIPKVKIDFADDLAYLNFETEANSDICS